MADAWGGSWGDPSAWAETWEARVAVPPEPPVVRTKGFAGWSTYTEEELRAIEEARKRRERNKRERELAIRRAVERAFAELTGEPLPADLELLETPETLEQPDAATTRWVGRDLVPVRDVEKVSRVLSRLEARFDEIEQADIKYRLAMRLAAAEEDEIAALLLLEV